MLGAAAVPFAALNCPVMEAWPSRGNELVISDAMSVKLAFTELDSIVVPAENEFGTVIVPEPLRANCCLPGQGRITGLICMDTDLERRVAALEQRFRELAEREHSDKRAIPRIILFWTVATIALVAAVKAYWP